MPAVRIPSAPVTLIGGPTAGGKSALATALAERTGGVVLNADSLQIYRDLPILTARPDAADEERAEHRLYGVADAAETWSTGTWLRAAAPILADARAAGRPVYVVGGTGLYFAALTRGLADVPAVPAAVRRAARTRLDAIGETAFRGEVRLRDPEAADRIAVGDRQRLLRAWEVAEATGRSLSDWRAETRPALADGSYAAVVVEPARAELHRRCDARFDAMIARGALDEARAFLARRLDPDLTAMKALGLRELGRHLSGELSLDEARALAKQRTRQYAKRQSTWFRNQTPDWLRIDAEALPG